MRILLLFVALFIKNFALAGSSVKPAKVLVFSKTTGFRHKSIEAGVEALKKLGSENNFTVTATEDGEVFNYSNLKKYKVVIFLSPTGDDLLTDKQKTEFIKYIHKQGGFVGIHAATDCFSNWPWYGKLVGAYFANHPKVQPATLLTTNTEHLSTKLLPLQWSITDEWYNFKDVDTDINVLVNLDEKSYSGGKMGDEHPIAWYHEHEGGRAFYTGLGHTAETFSDTTFLKHLLGGIKYAGNF